MLFQVGTGSLGGTVFSGGTFYPSANYGYIMPINARAIRAYSRKKGYACGMTKKGQNSSVKGHNCGFLPLIFPKLGHLECNSPLNSMCF